MPRDGFPKYLHCMHSLHFLKDISQFSDSSQLYVLVYVHYMSWDVFPMYLHWSYSLHFLERFADFFF